MAYANLEITNSCEDAEEIIIGNITKCFSIWVGISATTIIIGYFISHYVGHHFPNFTLTILFTLSISIALLLLVAICIGCISQYQKKSLAWKKTLLLISTCFIITTIIAFLLIELFMLGINAGIH